MINANKIEYLFDNMSRRAIYSKKNWRIIKDEGMLLIIVYQYEPTDL